MDPPKRGNIFYFSKNEKQIRELKYGKTIYATHGSKSPGGNNGNSNYSDLSIRLL